MTINPNAMKATTMGHREIYIKTLARAKARDHARSIYRLATSGSSEASMCDLEHELAGLLFASMNEFAETWTAELERRLDAMIRCQEDMQVLELNNYLVVKGAKRGDQ